MKITISGLPGAGKTTVGKELAEHLGYKFKSIGDLRGEFAKEKGMTIDELNEKGKTDPTVDTNFEVYQQKFGKENNDIVIEGRMSYHFIPDSIKIFITTDPKTAAQRIFKDQRDDEKKCDSQKETLDTIKKRLQNDKERYQKNYKLNPYDITQYDIIMDTTDMPKEEMIKTLLKRIKANQNQK